MAIHGAHGMVCWSGGACMLWATDAACGISSIELIRLACTYLAVTGIRCHTPQQMHTTQDPAEPWLGILLQPGGDTSSSRCTTAKHGHSLDSIHVWSSDGTELVSSHGQLIAATARGQEGHEAFHRDRNCHST